MADNETIITVGATEKDSYGNLWVTPQGGGDRIKIATKRENLHSLFQQGRAVILHWETYMNKPYVSDAKLVEGELPLPQKPIQPAPVEGEPSEEELGHLVKEAKKIGAEVIGDSRQISIERQSARKDAVEIECALIQSGVVIINGKYPAERIEKILERAEKFYQFGKY
jgi:hypothetical protein